MAGIRGGKANRRIVRGDPGDQINWMSRGAISR